MKPNSKKSKESETEKMLNDMIHLYDVCFSIVLLYDEKGSILRWNDAATQLLNKHGELLSQTMVDLLPNLFMMYNGKLYVEPCNLKTSVKSLLYPKNHIGIPVRTKLRYETLNGDSIGICFIQDLTGLMENKIEKTEFMNYMTNVVQTRMEFLVRITHDLKTPLNGISGLIEYMKQEVKTSEQLESLRLMKDCCTHMRHMIDQVLEYEVLCNGERELKEDYVDLYRIIENVVVIHQLMADEKGLHIYVNISEHIPSIVYTDGDKIAEILTNLMTNAIKFTQIGFISLNVLCAYAEGNDMVLLFMVGDTGIGIPKERWESSFEPYRTSSQATNRRYEGTGLGLAIVKQLVTKMNGKMQLESKVSEGSRFYFTIPVKLDAQEAQVDMQNIGNEEQLKQWIIQMKEQVVLDAEKQHYQKVIQMKHFGTKENRVELFQMLTNLRQSILQDKWENVEDSFDKMKVLMSTAQYEFQELLLKIELSARRYDRENALLLLNQLQDYIGTNV